MLTCFALASLHIPKVSDHMAQVLKVIESQPHKWDFTLLFIQHFAAKCRWSEKHYYYLLFMKAKLDILLVWKMYRMSLKTQFSTPAVPHWFNPILFSLKCTLQWSISAADFSNISAVCCKCSHQWQSIQQHTESQVKAERTTYIKPERLYVLLESSTNCPFSRVRWWEGRVC